MLGRRGVVVALVFERVVRAVQAESVPRTRRTRTRFSLAINSTQTLAAPTNARRVCSIRPRWGGFRKCAVTNARVFRLAAAGSLRQRDNHNHSVARPSGRPNEGVLRPTLLHPSF